MRDVTLAEGPGAQPTLFAVGEDTTPHGDTNAAVWASTDGSSWTESVTGGLGGPLEQQMDSVVALNGSIVAGGFRQTASGGRDAAVWVSENSGLTWQRVDQDSLGGDGDQQINGLTTGGPGLVAVGQETIGGDTNAVVWTSTDGSVWSRVDDPSARFGGDGPQRMFTVTSSPFGAVAAGADGVGADSDAAVWTSIEGSTWGRLPPGTPAMSALTGYGGDLVKVLVPAPGRLLALGAESQGLSEVADVWVGRPVG
jgi:hypothetical protein